MAHDSRFIPDMEATVVETETSAMASLIIMELEESALHFGKSEHSFKVRDIMHVCKKFKSMEKALGLIHKYTDITLAKHIEEDDKFMPSKSDYWPIVTISNAALKDDPIKDGR